MQPQPAQPDPQAGAAPQRARRLRQLVIGLGALAAVSVLGGTGLSLWRMHDEAIRQAENHLLGLAQVLGVQILRSTYAVDTVLSAAAEDAQRAAQRGRIVGSEALQQHLRETIAGTPYVRALLVTDAGGKRLVHTMAFAPQTIDVGDSDYFHAHQAGGGRELVISAPLTDRIGGRLSIPISRRVDDADGRFLGVVAADVDPAYFLWSQSLQELGPKGVVRLLRRDGVLLTGYPLELAAAVSNYRDSALFTQGVQTGRSLLRHAGVGIADERVSAIYPLKEYPLVLTVTTSTEFILRPWKDAVWLFSGIAALTAAFLGLITFGLAHQLRVDEELKAALMQSEERLQAIIQSAMDAIITLDGQQRIVLFNAAAEQLFCCLSADATGAGIGRFILGDLIAPPADAAAAGVSGTPVRRMGQHLALTGVRAGGEQFPIDASVSQVQIHGADLFIVILRDITERRRVEAVLRENEQRYRALFNQAMDGILLLDMRGKIISVNDAFARMHGYEVEELVNMNLNDLDTPATRALMPQRYARTLARESIGFEVEHYHKDGHVVPMDVAVSAIDIDGKLHALAFHRDITERRRAEQELSRSQQQLRGLSKAANEALEAERRRTARELHDELGQLLTALKMDLESLRAALPADAPDLGKRTQAMHAMLDTTIAATRRIAADLRPLMLDDLGLAAALDWLTQNFSKHTGIATDLVIDETVAQVPEPIASALYRITQESLTNITKYAQATTTEIRLERDDDWVQLTVRDNGRGIEAADQNKQGTFGLLGIRERVMLLSGQVTIQGEPGTGSELRARIPLAAGKTRETAA